MTTLSAGLTGFSARVMGLSGSDNGSMDTHIKVSDEVAVSSSQDHDFPAAVNTRTEGLEPATDRVNTFPAAVYDLRQAVSTFAGTLHDLRPAVKVVPARVTDRGSILSTFFPTDHSLVVRVAPFGDESFPQPTRVHGQAATHCALPNAGYASLARVHTISGAVTRATPGLTEFAARATTRRPTDSSVARAGAESSEAVSGS